MPPVKRPRLGPANAGLTPPPRRAGAAVAPAAAPVAATTFDDALADLLTTTAPLSLRTAAALEPFVPPPDLDAVAARLAAANAAISGALPQSKYGSSLDDFCYRRVASHVAALADLIGVEGARLEAAAEWSAVLRYVDVAMAEVRDSLLWDDAHHNKWRGAVEKKLAWLALKAVRALIKGPAGRAELAAVAEAYGERWPTLVKPLRTAIAKRKH
ncbi:hypothetical protein BU14_0072s0050 [Porphyra umbilicalis]|uniref:Uncharacterized protein n=1 Tax=Porphyra umbilicalis TaxID=2786 RepID=A0A1X6PFQ7_PORUM|nr:hypothetical protein BU14_0072s0050 [Porphyra umbilicalis]|eukprot:OSX79692.1 hypothetical protein BU14_0072s0050 [Porphyra umbilicalis]